MVLDSRFGVLPMTEQAQMWGNLLKRLQSEIYRECRGHGLAILSVKLMIRDGDLRGWTQPIVTYTEPRRHGGPELGGEILDDAAIVALADS